MLSHIEYLFIISFIDNLIILLIFILTTLAKDIHEFEKIKLLKQELNCKEGIIT